MTHDPTDDVLKDLEAALTVTPSPAFVDGVRARVAADSKRRRTWPVWAAVGFAAAAGIVVTVVAWPLRAPASPPIAITTSRPIESPAPAPAAPTAAVTSVPTRLARPVPRADAHVDRRRDSMPEVLVSSDQVDGLRALVAKLNDGTIDAASLATAPPDAAVPLPPVPDIVVPAIVIPSIDGSGRDGSGSGIKQPER